MVIPDAKVYFTDQINAGWEMKSHKRITKLVFLFSFFFVGAGGVHGATGEAEKTPGPKFSSGVQRSAEPKAESAIISQARELIDTYYGNGNLVKASRLLELAYQADPNDPHFFVQAARVVVMGGHISYYNFQPNTLELYEVLVDRAIALDGFNVKARILKAEVLGLRKQYAEQLIELQKAQMLGTNDPWLWIGFGRHYDSVNEPYKAFTMYTEVERRGPGSTASDRKAYVNALLNIGDTYLPGENATQKLKKYSELALAGRYPTDAWTPNNIAEKFNYYGQFNDAITYSREALKTMNFPAARYSLAVALYGRAAQLVLARKPEADSKPFIDEAKELGFPKADILNFFKNRINEEAGGHALIPVLNRIVPEKELGVKQPA